MNLKKFISCFLILILSVVHSIPVFADETSFMYCIKNTNIDNVKAIVDFYARQNNMPEVSGNTDYTFVLCSSEKDDFWIALFERDEENVSLYLYSPFDKTNVVKDLKIRFKKNSLKYSKERSSSLLKLKKQEAEQILNKILNARANNSFPNPEKITNSFDNTNSVSGAYDFSDEAQARFDAGLKQNNVNSSVQNSIRQSAYEIENVSKYEQKYQEKNLKRGNIEINQNVDSSKNVIPAGITLLVSLQSSINTSSFDEKDCLSGTLRDDVRLGNVVIPAGSIVYGSATSADKAGGAYRDGSLTIKFDRILSLDGKEYLFNSSAIVFKNTNSGIRRATKVSGRVLVTTLAGIALAALTGAICQTDDWGKTIAVGAASGIVSGGISLIGANGQDVEIKEGAVLSVVTE